MTSPFRSLRVRNYRLFAAGQVVSLTGTWAQRVAQDLLVLKLSHGSGTALGITTGLQFLPLLLFSLPGGVLADRYDKRRLLVVAQAAMGVQALVLGLLDVTGAVQLWMVFALAFALGLGSALDVPTRQSFVVELVGSTDLPNAVSLNSATFNLARIIGPAVAGLSVAAIGTGPVFLVNAASYLAVIAGLLAMRPAELRPARQAPRGRGQLAEGLRHVRHTPELLLAMTLVLFVGTFGLNFQVTLALMATNEFHRGASGLGTLTSLLAAGSLLAALAAATRGRPSQRLLVGSAVVFGLLELADGLVPGYLGLAVLLVPTGMAVLTFTTAANSTVQLAAAPELRGRVMAIYVLVFLGTTPFGAPVIGWLAERLGPRSGLVIGGAVTTAAALLIGTALLVRGRRVRRRPASMPVAVPALERTASAA